MSAPPPLAPARSALAGFLLLAVAGCVGTMDGKATAAPQLATGEQCLLPQQVNGHSMAPEGPGGEERLYLHTGARERWLVEAGACPDLAFSSGIALDTRFNGTRLCTGETATLIVPSGSDGAPGHCNARVLGKLARR